MKFKKICIGGTFDHLHRGHKKLLDAAFAHGDKVLIGLTSDKMVASMEKKHPSLIEDYSTRKKRLEQFLGSKNYRILKIEDEIGFGLDPGLEAIVVTRSTKSNAEKINELRKEKGLPELKLICVKKTGESSAKKRARISRRQTIKAIIFDIGGVYFTTPTKRFITFIHKKYDIPEDKAEKVIDGDIGTEYRIGKITETEFWTRILKILGIKEDFRKLKRVWLEGYKPITETQEIAKKLRKNYKVAFLSDNTKERVEYLNEQFDFLKNFDCGVFSNEVGMRKPDPKIYELVLKKLNLDPDETIFIDDKESSLKPAEDLGMKTILFKNPEQLEKELRELDIKF